MPVTLEFPPPVTEVKITKVIHELWENDIHLKQDSRDEHNVVFKFIDRTPNDWDRMADLFSLWASSSEPLIVTYRATAD